MNLKALLSQTATWWASTGNDGYGKPTFASPSPVDCRWEDWRSLVLSGTMEESRITARVFLDFAPTVGDYLYEGESTEEDPTTVKDAREVLRVTKMPTVDAQQSLYAAALFSS